MQSKRHKKVVCLIVYKCSLGLEHRKDTNSNQNAKGKRKKKAVKPKFHRLSFLKRGDVNK